MNHIISNFRLPWVIFTFLVFALLMKLGFWQIARANEKETRLANIEQLSQKESLTLAQIKEIPSDEINDLPVKLKGSFLADKMFFLDNQPNKGQLGYKVYQPFANGDDIVLLNLGWVVGSINRQELPDIQPIVGEYEIKGHIRLVEQGFMLMEQKLPENQWPLRIQQIELDKFSQLIENELLPFVVYLDKTESLGYKKNWQPIVMPPVKHRAYAFQWFSLAAAWLTLMFWASIKFSMKETQNNSKNKDNNKV